MSTLLCYWPRHRLGHQSAVTTRWGVDSLCSECSTRGAQLLSYSAIMTVLPGKVSSQLSGEGLTPFSETLENFCQWQTRLNPEMNGLVGDRRISYRDNPSVLVSQDLALPDGVDSNSLGRGDSDYSLLRVETVRLTLKDCRRVYSLLPSGCTSQRVVIWNFLVD